MGNTETKKFEIKKWHKVVAIVLASILVICLALGFISNKSLSRSEFSDYQYVNVYDNSGSSSPMCVIKAGDEDESKEYFDDGISSTSFSWLRGVLEYKFWGYGLEFRTYTETEDEIQYDDYGYPELDDDGNEETEEVETEYRYTMYGSDVSNVVKAGEGMFMLEFVFATQGEDRKSIKVEGEEVLFNKLYVIITDSGSILKEYPMYLVDEDQMHEDNAYEISPILFTSDFTTLYENLCEIKEIYTGSDDNGEYGGSSDDTTTDDETSEE